MLNVQQQNNFKPNFLDQKMKVGSSTVSAQVPYDDLLDRTNLQIYNTADLQDEIEEEEAPADRQNDTAEKVEDGGFGATAGGLAKDVYGDLSEDEEDDWIVDEFAEEGAQPARRQRRTKANGDLGLDEGAVEVKN